MSQSARFITADCFTGQFDNRTKFIDAMLGRLKLAARRDGWQGQQLHDVDWIEVKGEPDMAVIAIQPGTGDVNVADVRIFLIEKKKLERTAA